MKPAVTFSQVLGQVVQSRRKATNITQAAVAEMLKLSQSGLSRLERGQVPFAIPQLRRSANLLRVPASALLEEAERCSEVLQRQGVAVLEDVGAADLAGQWLWVRPSAIVAAISSGTSAEKRATVAAYSAKAKNKQAQRVHVQTGRK